MTRSKFFPLLFAALLASRLCHLGILWAEENLPMAAAAQMLRGAVLYRDAWFDKPPLLPAIYLLWGVRDGFPLRLAGALYVLLACWLMHRFARELWGEREALWSAGLLAFSLTFFFPSAVIPLAADLTMLAPHIAAVYLAWKKRPFWSGAAAGLAFLVNSKALFVLAACALWSWRSLPWLGLGFLAPNAVALAWMGFTGALIPYYEQVWKWGRLYAASTFVERPLWNALARTGGWLAFHAAAVVAAGWALRREPNWRLVGWAVISFAAVALGWRFFPRYYFQLLPVVVLLAGRGFTLLGRRAWLVALLLLIPLARFGPRYVMLAAGDRQWADIAMDQDSRAAAKLVGTVQRPGDTLLVWGFRPEMFVYTGLPAGTRFLDSQPFTGVPADRHLVQSGSIESEMTRANRAELARTRPSIVLDGLGLYNPSLAITAYPDLREWLAGYEEAGRTRTFVLYHRISDDNIKK